MYISGYVISVWSKEKLAGIEKKTELCRFPWRYSMADPCPTTTGNSVFDQNGGHFQFTLLLHSINNISISLWCA